MERNEIEGMLSDLLEDIRLYTGTDCEQEVRSWLMAATLRVWSGNELFSDDYIRILPSLVERSYTYAEVLTALHCAGEVSRQLAIPDFFIQIVEGDLQQNTSNSRTVADTIGRLLAELALINGDFTMEEAAMLREISDLLLKYCDFRKVMPGKEREYRPQMITARNPAAYYQPDPDEKKPKLSVELLSVDGVPVSSAPNVTFTPSSNSTNIIRPSVDQPEEAEDPTEPNIGVSIQKPQPPEVQEGETLESVLAELDGLVGLDKVKEDVKSLLNFIKICRLRTQRGMKVPTISYHLVFTGNPGTGKTTIARMVAKLYYLMGILPQGQLVETDRSGLVAGYLGQTAIKTQKVITEAIGGVLFIDEAYSLVNDEDDSYGKEAIETILKAMEDHRDELVVIVAGYDNLMHQFIDSNPGLRSRFNKYFHFPDYNSDELLRILQRFCDTNGYQLSEEVIPQLQQKFDILYQNREEHFGNARMIRNLFEHAIAHQANRLVLDTAITDKELAELKTEDIEKALEAM